MPLRTVPAETQGAAAVAVMEGVAAARGMVGVTQCKLKGVHNLKGWIMYPKNCKKNRAHNLKKLTYSDTAP